MLLLFPSVFLSASTAALSYRHHGHRHDVSEDSLAGVAEKKPQSAWTWLTTWLSPAAFGVAVTVAVVVAGLLLLKAVPS